jgi:hypothetical protein
LSIIQGPVPVAPCQTLISRFATFSSLYVGGGAAGGGGSLQAGGAAAHAAVELQSGTPAGRLGSTPAHPKVDTNCTAPSLIPTVNGNTVLSFSTHGQQSAAKGSSTTVSRSDIRLIQHLDSSAHGLVRRKLLIGYFPIHLLTTPAHPYKSIAELINPRSYA